MPVAVAVAGGKTRAVAVVMTLVVVRAVAVVDAVAWRSGEVGGGSGGEVGGGSECR